MLLERRDASAALAELEAALPALGDLADVHLNHAMALRALGRYAEAQAAAKRAVAVEPSNALARSNLARLLLEDGQAHDALAEAAEAARLAPSLPAAHANLAGALLQLGRHAEAEAALRNALGLTPGVAALWVDLAHALLAQGSAAAAAEAARRAVALSPGLAVAHGNLGAALRAAGDAEGAAVALREAARLAPEDAEMLLNLGGVLTELADTKGARDALDRARALAPDDPRVAFALGQFHGLCGRPDLGAPLLEAAIGQVPDAAFEAFALRRAMCDWQDHDAREAAARASVSGQIFGLLSLAASPTELLAAARRHAATLRQPPARRFASGAPRPRAGRRLRIGYLSANFRRHPGAFLVTGVIEQHDRARFEIIGCDAGPEDDSPIRKRLLAAFDARLPLWRVPDAEAARRLHEARLDILVDLNGYQHLGRTALLAYRPAPVQAGWLGFAGPLGTDFIDYAMVDHHVAPEGHERFYTEALVRLPHSYQANDDRRVIANPGPTRAACGLPAQGFVFCCFNNLNKLTPAVFDVWMRLLRAVPGSVLWLLEDKPWAATNLRREAMRRGVEPSRLHFARRVASDAHLARQRHADLFLDTLPFNAHTTASDALWAGVPVLTVTGETFAGRVGTSLLHAVGLAELVTGTWAEYEALAIELARDPRRLASLRARLAANRATAKLFDTAGFARGLEAAYDEMWRRHEAGEAPCGFDVLPRER